MKTCQYLIEVTYMQNKADILVVFYCSPLLDPTWQTVETVHSKLCTRNSQNRPRSFTQTLFWWQKSCGSTLSWPHCKGTCGNLSLVEWSLISQKSRESVWPNTSQGQTDDEQAMAELVKCSPDVTHSLDKCQEPTPVIHFIAVIDANECSSLTRLFRISAYVCVSLGTSKQKYQEIPTE